MKLDKEFTKEVKKAANGDGSRDYGFKLLKELKEISSELGNRYAFDECLKKHGRAKVALCAAATISYYADDPRYETLEKRWSLEVMKLWTNQIGVRSRSDAVINLHPAILADNLYSLRNLTTEVE